MSTTIGRTVGFDLSVYDARPRETYGMYETRLAARRDAISTLGGGGGDRYVGGGSWARGDGGRAESFSGMVGAPGIGYASYSASAGLLVASGASGMRTGSSSYTSPYGGDRYYSRAFGRH